MRIVDDLSRFYKVVCFEFPNQGESPKDPELDHLMAYATFLVDFLEAVQVRADSVVAYGYSFGAHVLRAASLNIGVRFRGLILGGINPLLIRRYYVELLKSWIGVLRMSGIDGFCQFIALRIFSPRYYSENPGVHAALAATLHEAYDQDPSSLVALLSAPIAFYTEATRASVEQFDCPVHVVGCEDDLFVPGSFAQRYAEVIHARSFHMVRDCGHELIFEKTTELADILHEVMENYA
jgi:pimeloyl-ACP methyl ester carboxylesterase